MSGWILYRCRYACIYMLTALGVLCCFVVCKTLLASFFLPSSSLISIHITYVGWEGKEGIVDE